MSENPVPIPAGMTEYTIYFADNRQPICVFAVGLKATDHMIFLTDGPRIIAALPATEAACVVETDTVKKLISQCLQGSHQDMIGPHRELIVRICRGLRRVKS
jgi:hypothetical protein